MTSSKSPLDSLLAEFTPDEIVKHLRTAERAVRLQRIADVHPKTLDCLDYLSDYADRLGAPHELDKRLA